MKSLKFIVPYFIFFSAINPVTRVLCDDAAIAPASDPHAAASAPAAVPGTGPKSESKTFSMIYDPDSKKYFLGGAAKFALKQGAGSSLVDRIELSVDSGEFKEYNGALELTGEGKHSLKFRALNPVNQWSPVQFVEVFLDLTPPTTEVRFEEGKIFRDSRPESNLPTTNNLFTALNSTISLVAQDNLSGVQNIEYTWDPNGTFVPYSKPIYVDKAGPRVIYFRSTDRVGNVESTKHFDFIADGNAPTSEIKISGGFLKPININGNNYLSARDAVAYSIEAVDGESKVREIMVSVDGKPMSQYLKPIYFLQEGPHTLSYYGIDNVGNKEKVKNISVYTVCNAPRTNAIPIGKVVNSGGMNFARRDFMLKLDAKDNVVGLEKIEFRVDPDPDFKTYMEPLKFDKVGVHQVVYRAIDRTGNIEPSRNYRVNILETAPETLVETGQPLVVRDGVTYSPSPNTISLSVKNSGVAVAQTLVSVNDAPFVPYKSPVTITAERKLNKVSYRSIDELGNEEGVKTVTYHMIGSVPVIDLFISDTSNRQEQIRTDYFDKPAAPERPSRGVASPQPTGNSQKKGPN
jgi:hypothetical protein